MSGWEKSVERRAFEVEIVLCLETADYLLAFLLGMIRPISAPSKYDSNMLDQDKDCPRSRSRLRSSSISATGNEVLNHQSSCPGPFWVQQHHVIWKKGVTSRD